MTGIELNANVLDALLAGIVISPIAWHWGGLLSVLLASHGLWNWRQLEVIAGSLFAEKEKANATLHAVGDAIIATDVYRWQIII